MGPACRDRMFYPSAYSGSGAIKDRAGRFELADGGTLFLDEVGEIPLDLQSKLLRVLQEGQYERVGEEKTRHANVRIIAATNRDLKAEIDAGRFREDLYYRLNVFPVEIAPLRQRREDISMLAAKKFHRPRPPLTQANVMQLQGYDWPGNIRELQNVIERAVITLRGGRLQFDLPAGKPLRKDAAAGVAPAPAYRDADVLSEPEMRQRQRENIIAALRQSGGRIYGPHGAAAILGLKPTTLSSRIKSWGSAGKKLDSAYCRTFRLYAHTHN